MRLLGNAANIINAVYRNFPGSGGLRQTDLGYGRSAASGGPWEAMPEVGAGVAGRIGSGYGPPRGGGYGGMGAAPIPSEFGALNYSYKAANAPDYHREIPMGGTPGVYAIRNDELLSGPRRDIHRQMSFRDIIGGMHNRRRGRARGRR